MPRENLDHYKPYTNTMLSQILKQSRTGFFSFHPLPTPLGTTLSNYILSSITLLQVLDLCIEHDNIQTKNIQDFLDLNFANLYKSDYLPQVTLFSCCFCLKSPSLICFFHFTKRSVLITSSFIICCSHSLSLSHSLTLSLSLFLSLSLSLFLSIFLSLSLSLSLLSLPLS